MGRGGVRQKAAALQRAAYSFLACSCLAYRLIRFWRPQRANVTDAYVLLFASLAVLAIVAVCGVPVTDQVQLCSGKCAECC